jgi:hypothetical protein
MELLGVKTIILKTQLKEFSKILSWHFIKLKKSGIISNKEIIPDLHKIDKLSTILNLISCGIVK